MERIEMVEFVDQNPIGKSSRSNPATYVKAWDDVRSLFAAQPLSRNRGYKPSVFSFNTSGGRCETCEGEGRVSIGMQFMADVTLTCDACKGQTVHRCGARNRSGIWTNIHDVVDDGRGGLGLLSSSHQADRCGPGHRPKAGAPARCRVSAMSPFSGQSATTLSGGEAQRIKLGAFLAKGDRAGHTVFIFDEPTTGLHFHDVAQLLDRV